MPLRKLKQPKPYHGDDGRQAVRADHGGDGVGRVVEAVDDLEAERDQQCNAEQYEGADGEQLADAVDVRQRAVNGVADAANGEQHDAKIVLPSTFGRACRAVAVPRARAASVTMADFRRLLRSKSVFATLV